MKKISLILCALVAFAIIAACGPSDPNTGSGGSTSSSTTTTGTGGNGNSSNGGGGIGVGGNVNVCHPSYDDPFIVLDPTCDSCECNVANTTDPAFCKLWHDQGIELCPAGGNTCEPGVNRCGYNLPLGEAYQAPDAQCKLFVLGDTWTDENFNPGIFQSGYDANGQFGVDFGGLVGPLPNYYDSFSMTGKKARWNRANADTAESIECTFSADCQTLDCVYSPSGVSHSFWWQNHPGP